MSNNGAWKDACIKNPGGIVIVENNPTIRRASRQQARSKSTAQPRTTTTDYCDPTLDENKSKTVDRTNAWKQKYKEQRACIRIIMAIVFVLVLAAICDAIFIGIVFNKSTNVHRGSRRHRFCIEARGADELRDEDDDGVSTTINDPFGLAVGHFTVDEREHKLSWRLNYQLGGRCGLSAWHLHGPIGSDSLNAAVFKRLPSLPFGPAEQGQKSGTLRGHIELEEQEVRDLLHEPELFYLNFHSDEEGAQIIVDGGDVDKQATVQSDNCHPAGAMRGALNKICPNADFHPDDDDDGEQEEESENEEETSSANHSLSVGTFAWTITTIFTIMIVYNRT